MPIEECVSDDSVATLFFLFRSDGENASVVSAGSKMRPATRASRAALGDRANIMAGAAAAAGGNVAQAKKNHMGGWGANKVCLEKIQKSGK